MNNKTTQSDPAGCSLIDLGILKKGVPGISPAVATGLAEAATVCLEEQKHSSGIPMEVDGDFSGRFILSWDQVTEQVRRTWADLQEATESGACGMAALLVPRLTEFTIFERSRKGTGFDYWLAKENDKQPLFQNKSRLEVSGILSGDKSVIQSRVKQKLNQTKRSDGLLPAIVVVVEFGEPQSVMAEK